MTSTSPPPQAVEEAGDMGNDDFVLRLQPKHKAALRNYWRIFKYATVLDSAIIGASCLAAILGGLMMPLMYILFGRLIGTFTDFFKQGARETPAEFVAAVNATVLQIVYVFIAKFALTYFSNLGFRTTSLRISASIRVVYLRSLFSLPISTLDMLPTGQTAAIITTVANNLQLGISEKLGQIFSAVSMVLGSLVVAFTYDVLLTLATSLGLVVVAFVYAHYTPRITKILTQVMELDIQASAVAAEALAPSAARMLAACGAGEKMRSRYAALVDEGRRRGKAMAKAVALQNGLIFFIVYAIFALAFWYAFQMYMFMEITTPEPLIVVLLSTILTATSIGQLSAPLSAANQAADALVIFHTIIDFPKPVYGTAQDVSAAGDITLQNIHFAYPARPEAKILNNLNVTFPAGKVTAIVGPSGSGKSTIVGILQRWYEFNGDPVLNPLVLYFRSGLVSVSGRLLTELDPKWWRAQIGLVQQDNVLFDTSVYRNVEYGLVGTEWEHASPKVKARMIKEACRDAFADEFISRLPQGYQTTVGQTGMRLSGGQRQRLAIARAIVKHPKILILDEATSAIDVRSEGIVQAALDRASKGRTTIVIAHRLATIRKADNIVVLRGGQIVQSGTHETLLADVAGAYHALVAAQKVDVATQDRADDCDMGDPEKIRPLSPGTTWTEETLPVGKEETPPFDLVTSAYHREEKEQDDDDELDGLEGRVRVVEQPSSSARGTLWIILSEQAFRWYLYAIILLGAAAAGSATPLQAYLFATLTSLFSLWGNFLTDVVNFWVLMMLLLATGVGLGHGALGWSTTELGFDVTRTYRKEYFGNLLAKPASFFDDDENNSAGTLVGRLSTDPTQLQQLVGGSLASLVTPVFNLVGCILIALVFGWKLTLVSLIMTLPVVLVAMIYRVRYEMTLDAMSSAVFAESARFACESISAIRTAVSLTLEEDICQQYELLLRNHILDAFRAARVSVLLFALSDSIPLLCMAFVLWYGGQLLASHEYEPFQYMVVYIAVLQGGMSAGQWLSFGPNIANATSAAERILSTREDVEDDSVLNLDGLPPPTNSEKRGVDLEFKNVNFQYPTRAVSVISGLDLKIGRGQFAAIVGPSGCGKSTIIALLERFYTPQHGQILLDGTEICNMSLITYRHGISLVAQEPSLFSGTIRDNILLGVPADAINTISNDHVQRAAQDAGIHDFICSLPEGYDTAVGTCGLALSGGQKQRISLARALIRRPGLLLLDEATSSLDSETEARVQAALESMKGEMTMVVVAHRLATIRKADIIFVLGEGGMLIEQGDHADLVARRGVYYEMCQSQALDHE